MSYSTIRKQLNTRICKAETAPNTGSRMKIVIAAVASSQHLSGVTRHAANMARCLITCTDVSEVHLIVGAWQYDALLGAVAQDDSRLHIHGVNLSRGAISRNLWYYKELPRFATQIRADAVHFSYPSPVNRKAFSCPVIVTLHDLYPFDIPANFGISKVFFNRLVLRQCLRAADTIACVSESTQQRLDIHDPQQSFRKSRVIYNCVEPTVAIVAESPLPNWKGEPFFLCVAQHRHNKNIPLAIGVFRRLLGSDNVHPNALLVIIGIEGPETGRIHHCIDGAGLARQTILLHGLSDGDLQWCYRHCELLLAPSVIEGFGLPVVEAMLQHCRVVCSDIPAFREVGGSYCHYVSLQNSPEVAFVQAALTSLKQIKFRPVNTDRFSSASIAKAYLQLYKQLCPNNSAQGNKSSSSLMKFSEREKTQQ